MGHGNRVDSDGSEDVQRRSSRSVLRGALMHRLGAVRAHGPQAMRAAPRFGERKYEDPTKVHCYQ